MKTFKGIVASLAVVIALATITPSYGASSTISSPYAYSIVKATKADTKGKADKKAKKEEARKAKEQKKQQEKAAKEAKQSNAKKSASGK